MDEYELLVQPGNIGFYNSCEVTEIFAMFNGNEIINLFTLIVFQEVASKKIEKKYIGKRIKFDKKFTIGIVQYDLTIAKSREKFKNLSNGMRWNEIDTASNLLLLPKQYIPTNDGVPLNQILKNNYDNGSYIIEFFDEDKIEVAPMLEHSVRTNFDDICAEIYKRIPINLTGLKDRIGNFIFQFPVNIVDISSSAMRDWKGNHLYFAWHPSLIDIPDCNVLITEKLDNNIIGYASQAYNKLDHQSFETGSVNGITNILVTSSYKNLILYTSEGSYFKELEFAPSIIQPEPRLFKINGELQKITIKSTEVNNRTKRKEFNHHIQNRLYEADKKHLEETLKFKQYGKNTSHEEGINDLKTLIGSNDKNGIYLWDPFLSAHDILMTLFHSPTANVKLCAITALSTVKDDVLSKEQREQTKKRYKDELVDSDCNNMALNLEFRCRIHGYGWAFHDRFLIFPGTTERPAKAYSLGTSVNSYGKEHHILQEVSNPQRIADAFEELWNELNHEKCLIWKSR